MSTEPVKYRVAVLSNQNDTRNFFGGIYGINAYVFSVDQICMLLEKADRIHTKGINCADLDVQPVMSYHLYTGGRLIPEVSREEVAQVMQGVDVLIAMMSSTTPFYSITISEIYRCLLEDNLTEKCKRVIVRIVNVDTSRHGQENARDMNAETIMKQRGLDPAKLKGKLYVISDAGTAKTSKQSKGRKPKVTKQDGVQKYIADLRTSLLREVPKGTTTQPSLVREELKETIAQPVRETMSAGKALSGTISKDTKQGSVEKDIADLRASLLGEELKETIVQPVRETMSAGKAVLGTGQQLASWLGSLLEAISD